MVVNQLFTEKPSIEFINKFVATLGLQNINDNKEFTVLDMLQHNTIVALQPLQKELNELYLPCKRAYIANLTHKNIITILRQILKTIEHDLFSKEKFIGGVKYIVYRISTKTEKELINKQRLNAKNTKNSKNKKPEEYVIHFD